VLKALTRPGRLIPLVFSIFLTIGTVLLCLVGVFAGLFAARAVFAG